MNHYTWIYAAGGGRNYHVGLFHSSKSGHVLIYIGAKIVVVDFRVLDTKEYTFFIEDELCHINLDRRGDEMFYSFNIDRKADTPRNRARNAMERKFARQMLMTLGGLVVAVGLFMLWSRSVKKNAPSNKGRQLELYGMATVGRVLLKDTALSPHIFYQYVAGNEDFTFQTDLQSADLIRLSTYMPLENGDEFVVRYLPDKPHVSDIYFAQPTEKQVIRYKKKVAAKLAQLQAAAPPSLLTCTLDIAYEAKGVRALADLYFQDVPSSSNVSNNQQTYQQLLADSIFAKALAQTCQGR